MQSGDVIGINAFRVNQTLLTQRFAEGGYTIRETPHFLLFTREQAPATIVAHRFSPEEMDADIGHSILQELKPLGLLRDSQDFGDLFAAIVFSLSPSRPQQALQLYAVNTLRRYRSLLDGWSNGTSHRHIDDFAALYRRVRELIVGETLLDAGCSFGFFPLLMAEYVPSLKKIVGIDIRTDSFPIVRAIAEERMLNTVEYAQADLLNLSFATPASFDTVVALHVLEHFSEANMYVALFNLLKLTLRRLIIAVPYEAHEPEDAYGHKQLFTPARLEAIGSWCREQSSEIIMYSREDVIGGLLVLDK
jgi:2-polyprenyl-3-methyl-5-hydroxy-6-metoxy-1,4-benzoquinol methylase